MTDPRELPSLWRAQADAYEQDGVLGHAALLRRVAEELERTLTLWELEALTLEEAAAESGYSYSHLQRLVSEGEVPNAGEARAPRIRRGDLPRKASREPRLEAAPRGLADLVLTRRTR